MAEKSSPNLGMKIKNHWNHHLAAFSIVNSDESTQNQPQLLGCPRNLANGWDQWVVSPTYKRHILGL